MKMFSTWRNVLDACLFSAAVRSDANWRRPFLDWVRKSASRRTIRCSWATKSATRRRFFPTLWRVTASASISTPRPSTYAWKEIRRWSTWLAAITNFPSASMRSWSVLAVRPTVEGMNLEAAGVDYDKEAGILTNDYLQTSNPQIYAAGDVCSEKKFPHIETAAADLVVRNALFWGREKLSVLAIPWCTYTDPEIAHVGLYVKEAREKGIPVKTFTVMMNELDRAT